MVQAKTLQPNQTQSAHSRSTQKLDIWGATDVGREREGNEDTIFPQSNRQGFNYTPKDATFTQKGHLLIVADGIGGSQAGSEASQWAVRRAVEKYYELPGHNIGEDLRDSIVHANTSLYQYVRSINAPDAGCTMTAAIIHDHELFIANVGDSRAYLIRKGSIYQLTRDHTLTQQKIDQGLIDPQMAKADASRSILTRSLGALPNVQVDLFSPTTLESGDLVLLCSDGLFDMVENAEIARLAQISTPKRAAQRLITAANRQGGLDNISVIIARIPEKAQDTVVPASPHKIQSLVRSLAIWQRILLVVLALLTLIIFSLMGWTIGKSMINKAQTINSTVTASATITNAENPPDNSAPTATLTLTAQIEPAGKATSTPLVTSENTTDTPTPTPTPKAPSAAASDRDGDQIVDTNDLCPNDAGSAEFNGCPDSDGDGVPDPDDECPAEGLASKPEDRDKPLVRGCLDTDQDGFPNISDACPEIWAAADTDGCPPAGSDSPDDSGDQCAEEKPACDGTLVCAEGEWKCLVVND